MSLVQKASRSTGTRRLRRQEANAGQLTLELLARILLAASRSLGTDMLQGSGLRTLAACARVSQHWQAAARLAATLVGTLYLPRQQRALHSPLVQAWAKRDTHLKFNVSDTLLLRDPALAVFLRDGCLALETLTVDRDSLLPSPMQSEEAAEIDAAHLEVALAPLHRLRHLNCWRLIPAFRLPPTLQTLSLYNAPGEGARFEALFVRLQLLTELEKVSITVSGQQLSLRQDMLCGTQLSGLRSLEIIMPSQEDGKLDLSWLSAPRSFILHILLVDRLNHSSGRWVQPLQALQDGVLQPCDQLSLMRKSELLCPASLALLQTLQSVSTVTVLV